MQIQVGSKLYGEYPITSLQECYYHVRKALNLPMFHLHSISIDFRQYHDRQFVFGFSQVPDSSYTGINTRAGQQMLVKIKPANASIATANMPDNLYITLLSEQIGNTRLRIESIRLNQRFNPIALRGIRLN